MYICPVCTRAYGDKNTFTAHYLKCWKDHNLWHQSKPAPQSEGTETREMNEDVRLFFERGQQCKKSQLNPT